MAFASTICPESLLTGLRLYFRRSIPDETETAFSESRLEEGEVPGISCPICKWRPLRSSRWMCADSGPPESFYDACGTAWNTFESRGLCPTCMHQWAWTSCLSCWGWSRHEDWYEDE